MNWRDWRAQIYPVAAALLTAEMLALAHLRGMWIVVRAAGAYIAAAILWEVFVRVYVRRVARQIKAKRGVS